MHAHERTHKLQTIAIRTILLLLFLQAVMHVLVIAGALPQDMVWGGRQQTREDLLKMEMLALAINLVMLFFALVRAAWLPIRMSTAAHKVVFWLMTVIFLLNTVGNSLSLNPIERYVFTPVALILAVCCFIVAVRKS